MSSILFSFSWGTENVNEIQSARCKRADAAEFETFSFCTEPGANVCWQCFKLCCYEERSYHFRPEFLYVLFEYTCAFCHLGLHHCSSVCPIFTDALALILCPLFFRTSGDTTRFCALGWWGSGSDVKKMTPTRWLLRCCTRLSLGPKPRLAGAERTARLGGQ